MYCVGLSSLPLSLCRGCNIFSSADVSYTDAPVPVLADRLSNRNEAFCWSLQGTTSDDGHLGSQAMGCPLLLSPSDGAAAASVRKPNLLVIVVLVDFVVVGFVVVDFVVAADVVVDVACMVE